VGVGDFFLSALIQTGYGAQPASNSMCSGSSFPVEEPPGREADPSPSIISEVKNKWRNISTPPTHLHGVCRKILYSEVDSNRPYTGLIVEILNIVNICNFNWYYNKMLNDMYCSTNILPVVLHGCETWSLTLREERKLRVFENMVLRRIFGRRR